MRLCRNQRSGCPGCPYLFQNFVAVVELAAVKQLDAFSKQRLRVWHRCRPSFLQKRINGHLNDRFVDFRRAPLADIAPNGLSVHLNREATLIGKGFRKSQYLQVAAFQLFGRRVRRPPIKRGMPGLLSCKFDCI